MASFSASPSSLVLDPFTSSGRTTNAAAYGNAVNLGNIYKANRANAFDPSSFIAQDTASKALEQSSAMQADANAYATSLSAEAMVSQAKKRAAEAQKQRDEIRGATREINTLKCEMHEIKSMLKTLLDKN